MTLQNRAVLLIASFIAVFSVWSADSQGVLPPPRLRVEGHVSASSVNIGGEETVIFICSFDSSYTEGVYFTLNCKGTDMDTQYVSIGRSMRTVLSTDKVKHGSCACFAHLKRAFPPMTEYSNFIYMYYPPPAGPIVAAVVTSVAGVAILFYICVFRISQKHVQDSQPVQNADTQDQAEVPTDNNTALPQGAPESTDENIASEI